jgi:hypothetical protein
MMKLVLMRTTTGMEDLELPVSHEDHHRNLRPRETSAAEDKFIRVTSLRNCSPNKCLIEFK